MAAINIKSLHRGDLVLVHSPSRLGAFASGLHVVLEVGDGRASVVPASNLSSFSNFSVVASDLVMAVRPAVVLADRLPASRPMDLGALPVVAAPVERPSEAARLKKAIAAKILHAVSVCDMPDPVTGKVRSYELQIPRAYRVPGEPDNVRLESIDGIPPGHAAPVRNYSRTGHRYVLVPEMVLPDFINGTPGSFRIPDPGVEDFRGGVYATPSVVDE